MNLKSPPPCIETSRNHPHLDITVPSANNEKIRRYTVACFDKRIKLKKLKDTVIPSIKTYIQQNINFFHGQKGKDRALKLIEILMRVNDYDVMRAFVNDYLKSELKKSRRAQNNQYTITDEECELLNGGKRILMAIRAHWQIENNCHWLLDVAYREDQSRIRNENAAMNMAWLRKTALALLKHAEHIKGSIRRKQLALWAKPEVAIKMLKI